MVFAATRRATRASGRVKNDRMRDWPVHGRRDNYLKTPRHTAIGVWLFIAW
jgi:hypothetical protein